MLLALLPVLATAADIQVQSAGYVDGNFVKIGVDDKIVVEGFGQRTVAGGGGIGVNYAIWNDWGVLKKSGSYNTYGSQYAAKNMAAMLDSTLKDGDILAVALGDEASHCLMDDILPAKLKDLGASMAYQFLMYEDNEGNFFPFKCGRHGEDYEDAESAFYKAQFDGENPKSSWRASYGLVLQVGGKVLAEKGSRALEGDVAITGSIDFRVTSTTTTTTTTDTALQALHDRLDDLEEQAKDNDNELVESLTTAVQDLEAKLEKEIADRKALETSIIEGDKTDRKEMEALLAEERDARMEAEQRIVSLETMMTDFMVQRFASMDIPESDGKSGNMCSNGGCAVPSVEADGETVTIKGSQVQFMSESCGATDLCELQRTVMALLERMTTKPE